MSNSLISSLEQDCLRSGRGRKAWWAKKLGIPPLTFSHWLAGRQNPNGTNAVAIRSILEGIEQDKREALWENRLWDCYYEGASVPNSLLPPIVLEILSRPLLKVRTAALLVRFLKNKNPTFEIPASATLRNRLGWLLETAGFTPLFSPDRTASVQSLFLRDSGTPSFKAYLKQHQTAHGRKWRVYDSSLDETVSSLPPDTREQIESAEDIVLGKLARLEPKDFEDIMSLRDLERIDEKGLLARLNQNAENLKLIGYRNHVKLFFSEVYGKTAVFEKGKVLLKS